MTRWVFAPQYKQRPFWIRCFFRASFCSGVRMGKPCWSSSIGVDPSPVGGGGGGAGVPVRGAWLVWLVGRVAKFGRGAAGPFVNLGAEGVDCLGPLGAGWDAFRSRILSWILTSIFRAAFINSPKVVAGGCS